MMTTIVAGRFTNVVDAEAALETLAGKGFRRDDTSEFFVNPPGQHGALLGNTNKDSLIGGDQFADAESTSAHRGAMAGATAGGIAGLAAAAAVPGIGVALAAGVAALGAYTGSFAGTMSRLGDDSRADETAASPGRAAGAMVAVRVINGAAERAAIDALHASGARDIERREGHWENRQWVDFDPVSPPARIDSPH